MIAGQELASRSTAIAKGTYLSPSFDFDWRAIEASTRHSIAGSSATSTSTTVATSTSSSSVGSIVPFATDSIATDDVTCHSSSCCFATTSCSDLSDPTKATATASIEATSLDSTSTATIDRCYSSNLAASTSSSSNFHSFVSSSPFDLVSCLDCIRSFVVIPIATGIEDSTSVHSTIPGSFGRLHQAS